MVPRGFSPHKIVPLDKITKVDHTVFAYFVFVQYRTKIEKKFANFSFFWWIFQNIQNFNSPSSRTISDLCSSKVNKYYLFTLVFLRFNIFDVYWKQTQTQTNQQTKLYMKSKTLKLQWIYCTYIHIPSLDIVLLYSLHDYLVPLYSVHDYDKHTLIITMYVLKYFIIMKSWFNKLLL